MALADNDNGAEGPRRNSGDGAEAAVRTLARLLGRRLARSAAANSTDPLLDTTSGAPLGRSSTAPDAATSSAASVMTAVSTAAEMASCRPSAAGTDADLRGGTLPTETPRPSLQRTPDDRRGPPSDEGGEDTR